MRDARNILELAQLPIDYIGFIFYEKSKRFVGHDFVPPASPAQLQKVGVFVDAPTDYMLAQAQRIGLAAAQLHGHESPDVCETMQSANLKVIKAFSVGAAFDFGQLEAYSDCCDYFLFDTQGKERGGNGTAFDWRLLADYRGTKPFFLSGGLSADNLADVRQLAGLPLHALDLNSRFETAPALKDIAALRGVLA